MFQLSLKRFVSMLTIQFCCLIIDAASNSFYNLAKGSKISIIFLFLFQDAVLILSITACIFSLYSTYVYQAGLGDLIFKKFRIPLIVYTIYFVLTSCLHAWLVIEDKPYGLQPKILTALLIVQRLFSPLYYYFYKRSALRISDPRFYDNIDWITEQLSIK